MESKLFKVNVSTIPTESFNTVIDETATADPPGAIDDKMVNVEPTILILNVPLRVTLTEAEAKFAADADFPSPMMPNPNTTKASSFLFIVSSLV